MNVSWEYFFPDIIFLHDRFETWSKDDLKNNHYYDFLLKYILKYLYDFYTSLSLKNLELTKNFFH